MAFKEFISKLKARRDRFTWDPSHIQMEPESPTKPDRSDRFTWSAKDLKIKRIDEKLQHNIETDGTFNKPHIEDGDWQKASTHPYYKDSRKDFEKHGNTLSDQHKSSISDYKETSTHLNDYLRHGEGTKKNASEEHYHLMHNLDHVTDHKMQHPAVVFRGVSRNMAHFAKNLRPGNEFTDDGYVSTSYNRGVASAFGHSDLSQNDFNIRNHVFKIHLRPGDRAHHLDSEAHNGHEYDHENEVLIPRKTKFRVMHHSQDNDYHYINLEVVHQPDKYND